MSVVIDASAALIWCFEDEAPEAADALLDSFVASGMLAPMHWPLEIANVLWVSQKRGRLTEGQAKSFIALLQALPIEIDGETAARAFGETRMLSERHALTVYDAAYLELAMRRGAGLVSKDRALLAAAAAVGVSTIAV